MVDLRRVGVALGRLFVRCVEAGLAALVVISVWALADLQRSTGPDPPEQAGTFAWAFLFAWFFATVGLVVLVGVHLLVGGHRSWSASGNRSLRRPLGRLLAEAAVGTAVVVAAPPLVPSVGAVVFGAPAALAWAVLVHVVVDAVRSGRSLLG